MIGRKSETQRYLLVDRTVNWTLTSWCNREALNPLMQDYTGEEAAKARAATEGVQPCRGRRQNLCSNGHTHVGDSVSCLL